MASSLLLPLCKSFHFLFSSQLFNFNVNLYLICSFLVDSTCGKIPSLTAAPQGISVRRFVLKVKSSETRESTSNANDNAMFNTNSRREFLGLALGGVSTLCIHSFDAANGAGLPTEEKPKLCDSTCEKELENVW